MASLSFFFFFDIPYFRNQVSYFNFWFMINGKKNEWEKIEFSDLSLIKALNYFLYKINHNLDNVSRLYILLSVLLTIFIVFGFQRQAIIRDKR